MSHHYHTLSYGLIEKMFNMLLSHLSDKFHTENRNIPLEFCHVHTTKLQP